MTGFVRGALAVTAGLALLATSAMAGIPSPANSDVEQVIVGNVTGNPLKAGGFGTAVTSVGFPVTVRDIGGNPIPGAVVTLNFNTAAGVTGPNGAAVVQTYEEQIGGATCDGNIISKTADGSGYVVFTAIFGGAENSESIEVRANGVLLRLCKARSTDLDGNMITGLADLAIFQAALFPCGGLCEEADFTISPSPVNPVGLADLALLQADIFNVNNVLRTICI